MEEKVVVSRLMGGLGNQMFQYAAGRALSLKTGARLELDKGSFSDSASNVTKRAYALDAFAIDPVFSRDFSEQISRRSLKEKAKALFGLNRFKVYHEKHPGYNNEFELLGANLCLVGFWQSEKYFKPYAGIIRSDFRFSDKVKTRAADWEPSITSRNSVSLHVRRGDYVSDSKTKAYHGAPGMDYYITALRRISEAVGQIEVFVFSDDIDWCRKNLALDYPAHFVDLGNAAAEMYLMSLCRHNVIANSSFSWWGAWLNPNPGKMVVAPKNWFQDIGSEHLDIFGEGWIRI